MNRRTPLVETGAEPESDQNILVTCARDGRHHVVAHVVLAESLAAGTGHCTAVCGHVVLPASLASPPGARCLLCAEATVPVTEPRRRDARREARRRWGAGLLTGRTVRASY